MRLPFVLISVRQKTKRATEDYGLLLRRPLRELSFAGEVNGLAQDSQRFLRTSNRSRFL